MITKFAISMKFVFSVATTGIIAVSTLFFAVKPTPRLQAQSQVPAVVPPTQSAKTDSLENVLGAKSASTYRKAIVLVKKSDEVNKLSKAVAAKKNKVIVKRAATEVPVCCDSMTSLNAGVPPEAVHSRGNFFYRLFHRAKK